MSKKILFIDRDNTLIEEPLDKQVDSIDKFKLKPNIIPALLAIKNAGYVFVMISNQDGLGTNSFNMIDFEIVQNLLVSILETQGIVFEDILICPHFDIDNCDCRKPRLGLLIPYFKERKINFEKSYVIGDRESDMQLAENMGIQGIRYSDEINWLDIANKLTSIPREARMHRTTKETNISVFVNIDQCKKIKIDTGIGFFDHMLEQLAKHGNFSLEILANGDLNIDEHHTVEDSAILLGKCLKQAIGDKLGIKRYGFLLPMDESLANTAIDLSGRGFFNFEGVFRREMIGDLPTELITHFFRSFSESLGAALHIKVTGDNEHHMVEAIFKSVGQVLRQAFIQEGYELPTTKGVL